MRLGVNAVPDVLTVPLNPCGDVSVRLCIHKGNCRVFRFGAPSREDEVLGAVALIAANTKRELLFNPRRPNIVSALCFAQRLFLYRCVVLFFYVIELVCEAG